VSALEQGRELGQGQALVQEQVFGGQEVLQLQVSQPLGVQPRLHLHATSVTF